jgi:hypothetical protein
MAGDSSIGLGSQRPLVSLGVTRRPAPAPQPADPNAQTRATAPSLRLDRARAPHAGAREAPRTEAARLYAQLGFPHDPILEIDPPFPARTFQRGQSSQQLLPRARVQPMRARPGGAP